MHFNRLGIGLLAMCLTGEHLKVISSDMFLEVLLWKRMGDVFRVCMQLKCSALTFETRLYSRWVMTADYTCCSCLREKDLSSRLFFELLFFVLMTTCYPKRLSSSCYLGYLCFLRWLFYQSYWYFIYKSSSLFRHSLFLLLLFLFFDGSAINPVLYASVVGIKLWGKY